MKLLTEYPEIVALAVNITMAVMFLVKGEEGKVLYWSGAALLTLGLLKMRG